MNIFKRIIRKIRNKIRPLYPNISSTSSVDYTVYVYNPANLIMDEDTGIGRDCLIMNTYAKLIMHRHSDISVRSVVITGNHPHFIGRFYRSISKKREKIDTSLYDKDVVVDEDCLISANVTLLSGVHIGRGSVIAAGAVVAQDIPPYSIAGGVPARVIRHKWSIEEVLKHESQIYTPEERFSKEELEMIFNKGKYLNKYKK